MEDEYGPHPQRGEVPSQGMLTNAFLMMTLPSYLQEVHSPVCVHVGVRRNQTTHGLQRI